MNAISGEYNSLPKIDVDAKISDNLKIGDIISLTFSSLDGDMAVLTTNNASLKTPAESIVGSLGQSLNFKVVDTKNNGVVMKQILEERKDRENESVDLSGDELLNWAKGAVLPITGAAFRSSKIRFEANEEQDREMLNALTKIKNDIMYLSKNVNSSALCMLSSNGISANSAAISMLTQAVKTAVKGVSAEPTEEEIVKALSDFAKKDNSTLYEQSMLSVKALISEDVNASESNVALLNSLQRKLSEIEGMSVNAKISFLQTGAEPTVGNLFASLHSGGANKSSMPANDWESMVDNVKKYFSRENIEIVKENLDGAKLLIGAEIPVNKENLDFINGRTQFLQTEQLLMQGAANLSNGISPFNVTALETGAFTGVNQRELFNNYKDIITSLPGITNKAIEMAVNSNRPVTLRNIINSQIRLDDSSLKEKPSENSPDGSFSGKGGGQNEDNRFVSERIMLNEIRLRLTLGAASQMAKAGVSIDGLTLQKAIDELKALEDKNNEAALSVAGAPVTKANKEEMSYRLSVFNAIKDSSDSTLRAVLLKEIDFTAEEVLNANVKAREQWALDGYKQAETAVNAKFGDSFSKVADQIEELLLSLGISPDGDNVKAAKSLIRTNTDVTEQHIEAIKSINNKIKFVSQNFHPIIAAEMIKDSFNPLTSHIDEVMSYINKFNEIYGEPPIESFEKAIFNMDVNKELQKEERDSLVAMYRMLFAINKNETTASAVIAKSGKSLTLENLMEAGKYYDKSKGRIGIIDKAADDTIREREALIPANSIRHQLNAAYNKAVKELSSSDINEDEAKEIADENYMGHTWENMEIIKTSVDNGLDTGELNTVSNMKDAVTDLIRAAKDSDAIDYFKQLTKEELEKTDVRTLLADMNEFIEKASIAEARRNMSESAAFNVFKEDLESLKSVSEQQIKWINSLNLPITIDNIKLAKEARMDDSLGKKLKMLDELAKNAIGYGIDSEKEMAVSDFANYIENGADLREHITGIANKIMDEAIQSDSPLKVSLLNQASIVRNAAIIAEKAADSNRHYQIPVKLHDKIGSLNVYLLNEEADPNNMSAFIRLDFSNLGVIEGSVSIVNGFADIAISADNERAAGYLKDNSAIMSRFMEDLGYKDYSITFGVNNRVESISPDNNLDVTPKAYPFSDGKMDVRL